MAEIAFQIDDPGNRMTLKVMLESEGHTVAAHGDTDAPVWITDHADLAAARVTPDRAVLVLSSADELPATVRAMRKGVFGYIFLPFQPGEAVLMVQRALDSLERGAAGSTPDGEGPIQTLESVEAEHIVDTLRRCKNNQAKTARVLGIGRNTLWRKLKKIETMQKLSPTPHDV